MQLTRETVANISNEGTKTFISTDNKNLDDPEEFEQDAEDEELLENAAGLNESKTVDNINSRDSSPIKVNLGSQSASGEARPASLQLPDKQDDNFEGASAGAA